MAKRLTEDKIWDEQMDFIEKKFGKKAAQSANYGWGVSGDKKSISIATKVYGKGIVITESDYKTITHEVKDF